LEKERQGEFFLLSEAVLWSLFPIITILSFTGVDPFFSAGLSTLAAAIFFAILMTFQRKWHELLIAKAWKFILIATFFLAIVYYPLVFLGTSLSTANTVSILLLMEVFFTQAILGAWGKESLNRRQVLGSIFMVAGAACILFPGEVDLRLGALIILFANAVPPVGNYYAQQARQLVSSSTIMFVRSSIGGIVLIIFAGSLGPLPTSEMLWAATPFLVINGFLLLGLSKIFWIEAIHRITISKAISLGSITPLFTMLFAYIILGEIPTLWQMLGLVPIMIGVNLLVYRKRV